MEVISNFRIAEFPVKILSHGSFSKEGYFPDVEIKLPVQKSTQSENSQFVHTKYCDGIHGMRKFIIWVSKNLWISRVDIRNPWTFKIREYK